MINRVNYTLIGIFLLLLQSLSAQQKNNIRLSLNDNPIKTSIELIDSAKYKVQAIVYKFEVRSLLDAIVRANKRGVKIQILVDGKEAKKKNSLVKLAKEKGVKIRKWKQSKLHAKLLIIDEKTVITGSFNWTKAANDKNIEILIIEDKKAIVDNYLLLFTDLWKKAKEQKNK